MSHSLQLMFHIFENTMLFVHVAICVKSSFIFKDFVRWHLFRKMCWVLVKCEIKIAFVKQKNFLLKRVKHLCTQFYIIFHYQYMQHISFFFLVLISSRRYEVIKICESDTGRAKISLHVILMRFEISWKRILFFSLSGKSPFSLHLSGSNDVRRRGMVLIRLVNEYILIYSISLKKINNLLKLLYNCQSFDFFLI